MKELPRCRFILDLVVIAGSFRRGRGGEYEEEREREHINLKLHLSPPQPPPPLIPLFHSSLICGGCCDEANLRHHLHHDHLLLKPKTIKVDLMEATEMKEQPLLLRRQRRGMAAAGRTDCGEPNSPPLIPAALLLPFLPSPLFSFISCYSSATVISPVESGGAALPASSSPSSILMRGWRFKEREKESCGGERKESGF